MGLLVLAIGAAATPATQAQDDPPLWLPNTVGLSGGAAETVTGACHPEGGTRLTYSGGGRGNASDWGRLDLTVAGSAMLGPLTPSPMAPVATRIESFPSGALAEADLGVTLTGVGGTATITVHPRPGRSDSHGWCAVFQHLDMRPWLGEDAGDVTGSYRRVDLAFDYEATTTRPGGAVTQETGSEPVNQTRIGCA